MNTILSIIVSPMKKLLLKLEMALINWIISEKNEKVEPMSVKTTYPAYKPPFNLWVKFMQSKGIFISTNQDFKIK